MSAVSSFWRWQLFRCCKTENRRRKNKKIRKLIRTKKKKKGPRGQTNYTQHISDRPPFHHPTLDSIHSYSTSIPANALRRWTVSSHQTIKWIYDKTLMPLKWETFRRYMENERAMADKDGKTTVSSRISGSIGQKWPSIAGPVLTHPSKMYIYSVYLLQLIELMFAVYPLYCVLFALY